MISIIIPTYNQENVLRETLISVLEQTYVDWECIIVDDGSSEITLKIINEFCRNDNRFKFFSLPYNRSQGGNACRNYGFQKSLGRFIQWFDADDLMHPKMLATKFEKLSASNADFVACEGYLFEGLKTNTKGKWDQLKSSCPLLDHALGRINFQTNALMFKREFLDKKKLWNEELLRKQDYEFYSRLLSTNPTYDVIENPLFYYRLHEKSINGRKLKTSFPSMIKADLLVFNNLKAAKEYSNEMQYVRRHFVRKIVARLNLGISILHIAGVLIGLKALFQIIDSAYLKNYFLAKV